MSFQKFFIKRLNLLDTSNEERNDKSQKQVRLSLLFFLTTGCIPEKKETTNKSSKTSEPRITRRMSKAKQIGQLKCVICLGNYDENPGKLTCGHSFCLECLIKWWKDHPNCPYCRQKILYIETKQGIMREEDLPFEEKEERDSMFVPHCELCWAQIDDWEPMNICTCCRGVYWHRRCLPFESKKWHCLECSGQRILLQENSD